MVKYFTIPHYATQMNRGVVVVVVIVVVVVVVVVGRGASHAFLKMGPSLSP